MALADGCEVLKTFYKAQNVLNNSNTVIILEALSTHGGVGVTISQLV